MSQRTITVRGSAKVSEAPDWVVISFSVNSKNYDYGKCLEQLAFQTESLRSELTSVGLERDSLKTSNFRINTDFKRVKENYIFDGYIATHEVYVEFAFEKEYLNKVLHVLGRTKSQASFNVSFIMKDPEPLRQKAISLAIKNAKDKAQLLADSAGVTLGEILQIDYSWSEVRFQSRMELSDVSESMAAPSYDITPDDVNVSDSVTVVWIIK